MAKAAKPFIIPESAKRALRETRLLGRDTRLFDPVEHTRDGRRRLRPHFSLASLRTRLLRLGREYDRIESWLEDPKNDDSPRARRRRKQERRPDPPDPSGLPTDQPKGMYAGMALGWKDQTRQGSPLDAISGADLTDSFLSLFLSWRTTFDQREWTADRVGDFVLALSVARLALHELQSDLADMDARQRVDQDYATEEVAEIMARVLRAFAPVLVFPDFFSNAAINKIARVRDNEKMQKQRRTPGAVQERQLMHARLGTKPWTAAHIWKTAGVIAEQDLHLVRGTRQFRGARNRLNKRVTPTFV